LVSASVGKFKRWSVSSRLLSVPSSYITGFVTYNKTTATGTFYGTDSGEPYVMTPSPYPDWRPTWDIIVPGVFYPTPGQEPTLTDFVFYDKTAGFGQFYDTDGAGGMTLLGNPYTDWRNSSFIEPVGT
jgi:hypothetical protein